jgi:hypothetical protein
MFFPLIAAKEGKPVPAEYDNDNEASAGEGVTGIPKSKHWEEFRKNSKSNEVWVGVNDVAGVPATSNE